MKGGCFCTAIAYLAYFSYLCPCNQDAMATIGGGSAKAKQTRTPRMHWHNGCTVFQDSRQLMKTSVLLDENSALLVENSTSLV